MAEAEQKTKSRRQKANSAQRGNERRGFKGERIARTRDGMSDGGSDSKGWLEASWCTSDAVNRKGGTKKEMWQRAKLRTRGLSRGCQATAKRRAKRCRVTGNMIPKDVS